MQVTFVKQRQKREFFSSDKSGIPSKFTKLFGLSGQSFRDVRDILVLLERQ